LAGQLGVRNNEHLTSCLNGKITVGHRFAIIANRYFPLSKALRLAVNGTKRSLVDIAARKLTII
ncbi:MAG: hypothetical protein P8M49_08850, partial [Thalassotalea sp.]|nr:hypothetical protein [Thalassotalea sp.]